MTQENPKEIFSANPPLPSGEGGGEGVKNKKILLVTRPICPPWDEASKNFAFQLAKNIRNCEITLLTCGKISGLTENIKQELIYSSAGFNFFQKLRLVIFLFFNAYKYDVIHLLFTPTKTNAWILKNIFKSPLTSLFQRGRMQVKLIQTIATLREDLYSAAEIKKMMFGDWIITYSQYAKNKLNSLGFNDAEQIYPGIDLNYYKPELKNKILLNSYFLNLNSFVVTYPGEYSRLGATDDIIRAIISLCHSEHSEESRLNVDLPDSAGSFIPPRSIQDDLRFVFACRVKNSKDGSKKQEVRSKLEKKGMLNKVIFTDTVPDMAKLYNISDVIIFPIGDMKGKFDIPLAVIEAMACGKPVILSDLAILKEFANENNSVIIEAGNSEQLKNAILDLYQNKNGREIISRNAQISIGKNFDIKRVAEKYGEIYSNL